MSTILVNAGGNLQAAINSAAFGDTIALEAGATFEACHELPVKSGSGTVTITSQGTIPAAGVRVSPSLAAGFPKVRATAGGQAAFRTLAGAHGYELVGLECPNNPGGFGEIISFGSGDDDQNTLASIPYDLGIDRCYIHGDPSIGQKRGVGLNSKNAWVKNSYISDCKLVGQDNQAICGWNGPGPFLIDNNYLEGAAENVLFGGDRVRVANVIPSDITFTNNDVVKPTAWRSQSWQVKNLFEIKNGKRIHIENNRFDWCWAAAQVGIPILFTLRVDSSPWNIIEDVTFTRNYVRHAGGAISILGKDDYDPNSLISRNFTFYNNEFYDISDSYGGSARILQLNNGGDNITFNHNTCINQQGQYGVTVYLIGAIPFNGLVITNNILKDNGLCVFNDQGFSAGTASLAGCAPGYVFNRNVLIGGYSPMYPAGNYFPASMADVGFLDYTASQYRLASSSPYHNLALDGTDIGATFTATGDAPPPVVPPTTPPTSAVAAASFHRLMQRMR